MCILIYISKAPNDNFYIINFLTLYAKESQSACHLLAFTFLCLHQKKSYKQQQLTLLWILLSAAASQGFTLLYVSLWDILGEVLWGKNYSVYCSVRIRRDSMKITGCLDAGQFMNDIHYYFSNYIGFLEMYFTVSLHELFSLFLHWKTTFLLMKIAISFL